MDVTRAPGFVLATSAGIVVAADQIPKAIIRHELTLCSAPPVELCDRVSIAGPLGLLRTENGDGALGLLAGEAIGPVMVVLLGVLIWQVARLRRTTSLVVAVGLFLGGLLANLVDRAQFGAVTDFIDIQWGDAQVGVVLNPADIGLAIGIAIVAARLYSKAGRGPAPDEDRSRQSA